MRFISDLRAPLLALAGIASAGLLLVAATEPPLVAAVRSGNRDTVQRSQAGSILQQLSLMNDAFVTNRTKVAASPALKAIAQVTDNNALVEQLFLTFLSRMPSDSERQAALGSLNAANTATLRNNAVEDLAWVLINKLEFLFSY